MTTNQLKNRLELAKLALGRLALLTIIASSCVNHNAAVYTLQKVIQLENVVQRLRRRWTLTRIIELGNARTQE